MTLMWSELIMIKNMEKITGLRANKNPEFQKRIKIFSNHKDLSRRCRPTQVTLSCWKIMKIIIGKIKTYWL